MSLQLIFHYVVQLADPPTVLAEDVSAGTSHDIILDSLPAITQQVEQNLSEFTCGDFAVKAMNDDGWWDTAFGDSKLSPFNRYPVCHWLDVYRNGVLVWQGDVDYKTISFDRKAKKVAFTCLNPISRLTQWSAELVRRAIPYFFDAGVSSEVGAGYLRDYSKAWLLSQVLNAVLIDSSGNVYQITGLYGMGTGDTRNGISFGTGYAAPYYTSQAPATPTAGSYRIVPIAVRTRVAPADPMKTGPVTTGVDGTGRYVRDASAGPIAPSFPTNAFQGMFLFDDAGLVYPIISNTGNTIYVTVPSGQAPPTIAPSRSDYAVRKAAYPNLLESLPDLRSVGLMGGDQLTFTTTGAPIVSDPKSGFGLMPDPQVNTYIIAATGPAPIGMPGGITANEAWTSESVKYDVIIPYDAVVVTTPYYRNKTVRELVTLLFQSLYSGGAAFAINAQDFSIDNKVPYADFAGKSVADALTELAVISNCTLSCGFAGGPSAPLVTFYFQRRDVGVDPTHDLPPGATLDLSGNDPSGLPLIATREDGRQWEQWYPQVTVSGANNVVAAVGSLRYGGSALSVSSNFITSYDWVAQIRDRLWSYFGARRATCKIKVRAEYAPSASLLSRVTLNGTDSWFIISITDPIRFPSDFVEFTLVSVQTWSFTPPDYLATTGPTDYGSGSTSPPPAPPQITSVVVTSEPLITWRRKVYLYWPFPVGPLLGFAVRIWPASAGRPDQPYAMAALTGSLPGIAMTKLINDGNGVFEHWIEGILSVATGYGPPPYVVEYSAVLAGGVSSGGSTWWELNELVTPPVAFSLGSSQPN